MCSFVRWKAQNINGIVVKEGKVGFIPMLTGILCRGLMQSIISGRDVKLQVFQSTSSMIWGRH